MRWTRPRLLVHASTVAAVLTSAGCHTRPVTPRAARSAPACPAHSRAQADWIVVTDSTGFSIDLPPGFQEHPSGGDFRHFEMTGDFNEAISVGTIRGNLGLAGYRRVYQPTLMLDYSECVEVVGGMSMSIQAWRTPNGVFRERRRLDRYDVFAIGETQPGVFAFITGGTYRRPTQDLLLAAVRSWRRRAGQ
jgi:hypothetical protein